MTANLSEQLRELQKSADELNAVTDKANDVVRRTEIFLREECRVGGSAAVHVPSLDSEPDPEGGPEFSIYLGYERYKGEYRIVITEVVDGDPLATRPWGESSRKIKLASLDALPNLIQDLLKSAQKQVSDVRAKVDLLDSMIPAPGESQGRRSSARKG